MRCRACDVELSDYESTRKHIETGDFVDLCSGCYRDVKNAVVEFSVLPKEVYMRLEDLDLLDDDDLLDNVYQRD